MLKFAVFVRTPSRCSLLPELNGDHVSLLYTFQNTSVQAIEAARTRQDRATRQPHQARADHARPRALRSAASERTSLFRQSDPAAVGGTRVAARRRAEPGSRGLTRTVVSRHTAPVHRHREPPRSSGTHQGAVNITDSYAARPTVCPGELLLYNYESSPYPPTGLRLARRTTHRALATPGRSDGATWKTRLEHTERRGW
jgi:hypothetical protein